MAPNAAVQRRRAALCALALYLSRVRCNCLLGVTAHLPGREARVRARSSDALRARVGPEFHSTRGVLLEAFYAVPVVSRQLPLRDSIASLRLRHYLSPSFASDARLRCLHRHVTLREHTITVEYQRRKYISRIRLVPCSCGDVGEREGRCLAAVDGK